MKSIIEEASSISKAIEKGWIRAGKPKNFSIKVYEEAEKNFFGLTTKSAKVAIIFDEKTVAVPAEKANQPAHQGHQRTEPRRTQSHKQPSASTTPAPQQKQKEPRKKTPVQHHAPQPHAPAESAEVSHEIKEAVSTWLYQTLPVMNIQNALFRLESSNQGIQVIFDSPLVADTHQEKAFLKSLSYLALATLRNKFKKGLRGLKLVFVRKHE